MVQYARRLNNIAPFKAMKVLDRANALEAQGRDIVHLEVGEPDFPTPAPIVAAAKEALDAGYTKYTPAPGLPELRAAIAREYLNSHNLTVDPARVFVTAGGSGALVLAMALTIDPGAEVLMTDPGYPCNRHFVSSVDGVPRLIPVDANCNFQLTAELVAQHWTDRTRAVLLASPANPSGAVLARSEMLAIAEVVRQRDGFLITDEIYHGLHYGAQYPTTGLEMDAIVINSFSKYYGMTGWRLGWLVVPEEAIPLVEKLAQNLFICASAVAQRAALGAFTAEAKTIMEQQREAFLQRRDLLVAGLRDLNFGIAQVPEGAFYVYARLPEGVNEDAETFCARLLEEFGVAVTAGADFGEFEAERHVRVSYANDLEQLQKALDGFARALA